MSDPKKVLNEEDLKEVAGGVYPQPTSCGVLNGYLFALNNHLSEENLKGWVLRMKKACDFSFNKKPECPNCQYLAAWNRYHS